MNILQVELPSQFMENWLYDKTTMNLVSGHYRTNETLPDELFQQVVKSRFNSSIDALVTVLWLASIISVLVLFSLEDE